MVRSRAHWPRALLALAMLFILATLPVPAARAATLTVANGVDGGPGSLRQAIADAAPGDTIRFADNVTAVVLTTGELVIDKSLTIDGGAAGVAIGRQDILPEFRIFNVSAGTAAFSRLTIAGGGESTGGGILVAAGANATLTNVTVSGNTVTGLGGGVQVLGTATLTNSVLSGNRASNGGGLSVGAGGEATVSNSTFSGNTTTSIGGGAMIVFGTVSVTASAIGANTAPVNGGGVNVQPSGVLTLANTTISGNASGSFGGGVSNLGSVTLTNVTFGVNTSTGGDSVATGGGNVTLAGSILTGNIPCNGTVIDGGYNLETGTTCGFTEPTSLGDTDPLLGPLAANGGPTQTHRPDLASPARDRIPAADCAALPGGAGGADQRGVARPQGTHCDIGAVEAEVYRLVASPAGGPPGGTTTLGATLTSDGVPIAGVTISFSLNGTVVGTAPTNAGGVATLGGVTLAGIAAGTYSGAVGASAPATAEYAAVSAVADLTVTPTGAPCAGFVDVADTDPVCPAIAALAERDVIKSYATTPPTYGPGDDVQRTQAAVMIVRALGWEGRPTGPRTFPDLANIADELQRAALILANACDGQGNCVAQGYADGRFGRFDDVSHAQVIALIARAFALDPSYAWATQPGGAPYTGVPATFLDEVATYHAAAGAIPDAPTTPAGWDAPASRAWVAQVLWQAIQAQP